VTSRSTSASGRPPSRLRLYRAVAQPEPSSDDAVAVIVAGVRSRSPRRGVAVRHRGQMPSGSHGIDVDRGVGRARRWRSMPRQAARPGGGARRRPTCRRARSEGALHRPRARPRTPRQGGLRGRGLGRVGPAASSSAAAEHYPCPRRPSNGRRHVTPSHDLALRSICWRCRPARLGDRDVEPGTGPEIAREPALAVLHVVDADSRRREAPIARPLARVPRGRRDGRRLIISLLLSELANAHPSLCSFTHDPSASGFVAEAADASEAPLGFGLDAWLERDLGGLACPRP